MAKRSLLSRCPPYYHVSESTKRWPCYATELAHHNYLLLCECEAWASLRHTHLGSFFLEPEDIKSLGLGAICSFAKAAGLS
jgi:hypothetical protein